MTTDEALHFLQSHQPLPPTHVVSEDAIRRFDEVRQFFLTHLDNRCIRLLLNSFGEGDGHGVYQLVEDTILVYPQHLVIPALVDGLCSPHGSVREWNAEIAANYSHPDLVLPLGNIIGKGSLGEQLAAVTALQCNGCPEAVHMLKNALALKVDAEVTNAVHQALRAFGDTAN